MQKVCFVGNCQMLSLCIFLDELLDSSMYSLQWLCYHESFQQHLGRWCRQPEDQQTFRCRVELDEEKSRQALSSCDILVFQYLSAKASPALSDYVGVEGAKKLTCKKVSFPTIEFKLDEFEYYYDNMKIREEKNDVSVPLADYLLNNYKSTDLLLTWRHPTTKMFKYMIRQIAEQAGLELDLKKLNDTKYDHPNYIGLP